ncbi:MAG: RHS repeat-associated core domain-containing protein [Ottowia sp.]|uniref:RHS repeat-associated core domain-containing protein n=1 Tax=Ottowia sp. TaxID=1898956 RepID=UPI0039E4E087
MDRFGTGSETGFEYRLTVVVSADGSVSQALLASCTAGDFSGADPIGQTAPRVATMPRGANLLAQLELSLPAQAVGAVPRSRIVLAADGDYINRLSPDSASAITLNGVGSGSGGGTALITQPVPTASLGVLAALAILLAGVGVVALRSIRHGVGAHLLLALVLVGLTGSGVAAVALVIDGATEDWAGLPPLAVDMTGDHVSGTADLHSITASFQGADLYLRIDAVEGANLRRDLSPLEAQSTLPRFSTHPGLVATVGQPWRYAPEATDQHGQALAISLAQGPAGMQLTGTAPSQQLAWTPAAAGTHWVTLRVQDGAGQTQTQTFPLYVSDDRQLPTDPAARATALSPTGFTPFAEHTAFLYQGVDPIQTGMQSGAIDPVTATVVRGQVLGGDGQPLPGATVRIAGHPEYGQTRTRADGWYDLAANGGGWITVHIEKPGYMSAQRRFQAPWRDWAIAPDVVLLPYDAQYTLITGGAAQPQMYWGSTISDGRGDRRTSVYFPAGTQATAVMPDGSTRALAQMNVRVSEYTVGSRGPQAMPAELNLAVGYTWAANFTVDEAETIGAKSVRFNKPVVAHIDNFIDMPVGSAVPIGWYDFDQTAWIGEDNGRIIKVLGVDAQGQAVVQVTTDERAATAAELQALGFDDDELVLLARTRAAGARLWRVRMAHFTPWDCNWPWGPPPDVEPPPSDPPPSDPPPPDEPPSDDPPPPDQPPLEGCPPGQICDTCPGCDIYIADRAVGQGIDVPGTPFGLYYRSDRINLGSRTQSVRATGNAMPPSLARIDVSQQVAGRTQMQSVPREGWSANASVSMTWDGRDAYGRLTNQGAVSSVRVSYIYPAVRYDVPADFARAFERVQPRISEAGAYITPDSRTSQVAVSRSYTEPLMRVNLPSAEVGIANAGSWALRGLRLYDPSAERLYDSGGQIFDAKARLPAGFTAQAQVSEVQPLQARQSALGADGALYFSDTNRHQIRRVWLYGARKGTTEVVAGTADTAGYAGDGGLATAASLNQPGALALAPDGALVFMDAGNRRLRRISPAGVIETVAGNGASDTPLNADGVPAAQHPMSASHLAVSRDMTIWGRTAWGELRQISPAGIVSRYALSGESVRQVVSSPDGIVWLNTERSIYHFNESGVLRAMTGTEGATELLPDQQGGVFFKSKGGQYSHLSRAGDVTVLGENYLNAVGYGATTPLATDAVGHLLGARMAYDQYPAAAVVGIIGAGLPPFGESAYRVARPDGSAVEEFDRLGRPTALRSAFGGQLLANYSYDANGQLASVADSHGNRTSFTRDGQGRITAITSPFGQRTTLAYSGAQLVQVQQPGGLTHGMAYASATSDLLTSYQDPRGGVDRFNYTAGGHLRANLDPAGGGRKLGTGGYQFNNWSGDGKHTVTTLSAEGRTSQHQVTAGNRYGTHAVVTTLSDGTQSTSRLLAYGAGDAQHASGLKTQTTRTADPRLGAAASQESLQLDYGNGLHGTISTGRILGNARDPDAWQDPLGWKQTTLLHGRDSWVTHYLGNGWFSQFSPLGRTQSVQLNAHQQAHSATLPSGLELGYTYNAAGQLAGLSSTDGATNRNASFSWHASGPGGGQLASRTNALGQTERFAYDAAGRLSAHTLLDGRTLNYGWDAAGNLASLTTPAGVTHSFSYSAVQLPSGYTPPAGSATQWTYDRDRQLASIVRPGGQSLTFSRLPSGQLSAITDSSGPRTNYTWRADGRPASAATADGQAIAYTYSGAQLQGVGYTLQGTSASLGLAYEQTFPSWGRTAITTGRIASLQLIAGGQTQSIAQRYDADGLLSASGPLQLGRDSASGQLGAIALDKLVTSQQHDAWGQLSSSATIGQGIGFGPEHASDQAALRALIQALGQHMSSHITQRSDCVVMNPTDDQLCQSKALTIARRPIHPSTRQITQGSAKRAKATKHPKAQASRTKSDEICGDGYIAVTSAEQAEQNNLPWPPRAPEWQSQDICQESLQSYIHQMLRELDAGYGASRLLMSLREIKTQFSEGPSYFLNPVRLPAPLPGTWSTSYIDPRAQSLIDQIEATLTAWQVGVPQWSKALAHSHSRDALGRITKTEEVLLAQQQPDKQYQYDTAGRLSRAQQGAIATTWAYDANGNRTHENGVEIARYDSQDKLQSWKGNTYQYNAAGDLASKTTAAGTASYAYDSRGNLRSVTLDDGRRISYAIDPDNRRTGKTVNGQLQWQLIWQSQLRPIARLKADNTLDAIYYYADKPNVPEAMDKGGKTYRIVSDQLGSVRLVIDADTGEVAQQMDYDAWGNVTQDTNPGFQPFGFAGGIYDPDTKLTRFGARDYDAETGRWTAKDPILFAGGDSNLYGYVLQNPVGFIDPTGLVAPAIAACFSNLACGGAAIGAAAAAAKICTDVGGWLKDWMFSEGGSGSNNNPYDNQPVTEPLIVVDDKGNAIPVPAGGWINSSPNGDYQQVIGPDGKPTGDRYDRGGHQNQKDPRARDPHGHRPGITTPEGNPHLPLYR